MATGAALATGRPQAFCVVPGPGFLNTTAALSTAYAVNAPVLALASQIPLGAQGKGHGLLHEIPDQFGILERLTKSSHRITGPQDAAETLQAAFRDLKSGRPRPVGLEVAVNLWGQAVADDGSRLEVAANAMPPLDTDAIDQAARLIAAARSPMIVVGGGAQDDARPFASLRIGLARPWSPFALVMA